VAESSPIVGSRKVLASGCITTSAPDEKISFIVSDVNFEFSFTSNVLMPSSVGHTLVSSTHIVFALNNFDNALGATWSDVVGLMSGKKLHVAFVVHLIGDVKSGGRLLNYTISLEQ
jgi:hypothetical protein